MAENEWMRESNNKNKHIFTRTKKKKKKKTIAGEKIEQKIIISTRE